MTLYTLTGLPYSGKSTLTKELVKRFGFKVISVDDIMNEKDMWRDGHPTMDDWNEAYTIAYDPLKKYITEDKDVIFDGGSLKFSERETQRKIAEYYGVERKMIYVNTSRKEIVQRKLRNETTKVRAQLSEKEMEDALGMFEEPRLEENPIFYNVDMDLDKWIKDYINI